MRATEPTPDPPRSAEALARRCAGLQDVSLRVAYLRHALRAAEPQIIVDAVAPMLAGPSGAWGLVLSIALCDDALADVRRRAAQHAADHGHGLAAELLGARAAEEPPDETPRVPDFGAGRPLTLGERKSLARGRNRDVLARVLRDPHPSVVEILLGNPALTELDIVRLVARRPNVPAILRSVARLPRWALRYEVRRALVQNPACPLDVALLLLPHLAGRDTATIAGLTELRKPVREAAARLARADQPH